MRRVVIGVDEHGRSCVVSDDQLEGPDNVSRSIWTIKPNENAARIAAVDSSHSPLKVPKGGAVWRDAYIHQWSAMRYPLHTTPTVDFTYVLEGDITLDLDEGSVELRAGDCVVQQATRHAWRNHRDHPVRLLTVLVASSES